MTSLKDFKTILEEQGVEGIPEGSLEVFRDLIDAQSDLILDQFLSAKGASEKSENSVK